MADMKESIRDGLNKSINDIEVMDGVSNIQVNGTTLTFRTQGYLNDMLNSPKVTKVPRHFRKVKTKGTIAIESYTVKKKPMEVGDMYDADSKDMEMRQRIEEEIIPALIRSVLGNMQDITE